MDAIVADPKTKAEIKKSSARKVKMFSKEYNNHSKRFSEAVTCRKNMKMVLACKVKLNNLRQAKQIAKGNLLPSK
jgi:Tfp pilus assembly major pilin PilA